ncbi:MAG TPA: carbonic anhydrase family protein [Candidatus Eisenbacteria bacterium]|nr:carbonic anhydrase family protein [Candidatus Eisenbacteria bacterium]
MNRSNRLTATAALLYATLVLGCTRTNQADTSASPAPAAHEGLHWSYEGETGPAAWGTLSPGWTPCGSGQSQSPIDIHETMRAELPAMKRQFLPAQLRIIHKEHVADEINNGHTIQVNYTGGDTLRIGDEAFELKQYHFHSPSEHTVGGKHYPMEMHLVHKSPAGQLAVIGVFIEEGLHNAAFDPVWANLPKTKGAETHVENVTVDINQLLPKSTASYRYDGSLTTPPCSEGVKWIVMATPIQLSTDQVGAFRALVHGNNRPVQPLNGRAVVTDHVATVAAGSR